MPRLIDADALMERLKFKRRISEVGLYCGLESAMSQCAKAPTVDAVEVVHGRWKYDSYNMRYYCTECDEEPCKYTKTFVDGSTLTEEFLTDYCPHCGAKMDGYGNA